MESPPTPDRIPALSTSASLLVRETREPASSGSGHPTREIHVVKPDDIAGVAGLRFERAPGGARSGLLMVGGVGARVNGLPAARLSLLEPGDVVRAADRSLLHVAAWEACEGVVPSGALLDRCCATCRSPLAADTRVRVCACGEPRHDEGDETAPDERRDCWQLGPCPGCGAAGRNEPGFLHWPQGVPLPQPEAE